MSNVLTSTHKGLTITMRVDFLCATYKAEWEHITKEQVQVQMIRGTIFAFGSEVAMLRLVNHYRGGCLFGESYATNNFFFAKE